MHPSGADYLVSIQSDSDIAPELMGAKAHSLQQIAALGLAVPPALVLTTRFFQPWFDLIEHTPDWQAWRAGQRAQWPALCNALKSHALTLPLTGLQRHALDELAARLPSLGKLARYAVRSSAPDEDKASSSFAGLYETALGVAAGELTLAIRRCFSSCFDERVFAYRAAQAMAVDRLSLALIIQQQIDSDVAGVGFSINPLTNDYDEMVVDANWGLGESVVAGAVTPDHFVVDKLDGKVVARQLGAKQVSVTLAPGSGTCSAPHPEHGAWCLSDAQLQELRGAIATLEQGYGYPVDVEWAYANATLFILQARPVTAWVPLPAPMLTAPGARRALYMDIALSKGMTSNEPISPLGLDWLAGDIGLMLEHCAGKAALDLRSPDKLLYLGGARMYMNLSNLLCFSSPAQLAKGNAPTDRLMADTLASIDCSRYRAAVRPPWIWPLLRSLPGALWRLRRALWRALRAVLAPESTHRMCQRQCQAFENQYARPLDNTLSLDAFRRRYGLPAIAHVIDVDMPALGVGVMAASMVMRLARTGEEQALAQQLLRGIAGNVVVDMGIRMFRTAKLLDADAFNDVEALQVRLQQRQLPAAFLAAWDQLVLDYGCRGPGEMDMANQHFADDPLLLLRQMSCMAGGAGQFDPDATHQRLARQREQAYDALSRRFGWIRRPLLRRAYRLIVLFGGTRDTPKHHNLMYQQAARRRLLVQGARLVQLGRIDRPAQVFDLTLSDLAAADTDPAVDLRVRASERTGFADTLKMHVRTFPAVIDSRGRIQRPARRPDKPGELTGMAVSPGLVRGQVKVLHTAHQKRVEKGEILVAFTTDPGWTPLFIHAAAVILEVGGVLQHGAVVAREYGKPCVAGIADVLTRFADGQWVEVDGSTGVVRFISGEHDT